jgi:hypothetical protein
MTIPTTDNLFDNRQPCTIHVAPNHIREDFIKKMSSLITKNNGNKKWSNLFGGSQARRYIKDMKINHPQLHDSIVNASSWYIEKIQGQYPKLKSHSFTSLLTSPNAEAQHFLHVDYNLRTQSRAIDEQPVSAIIAIESFTLDIVEYENKSELKSLTVNPGDMIVFTNKCIHRGGANKTSKYVRRIFMYCAHDPTDIDGQENTRYDWDTSSKKYAPIKQKDGSKSNYQRSSRRIRK